MIWPVLDFVVLIVFGAIGWYYVNGFTMDLIDYFTALSPTSYDPLVVAFLRGIMSVFFLFMIIGGLYGLWVWAQRSYAGGYY